MLSAGLSCAHSFGPGLALEGVLLKSVPRDWEQQQKGEDEEGGLRGSALPFVPLSALCFFVFTPPPPSIKQKFFCWWLHNGRTKGLWAFLSAPRYCWGGQKLSHFSHFFGLTPADHFLWPSSLCNAFPPSKSIGETLGQWILFCFNLWAFTGSLWESETDVINCAQGKTHYFETKLKSSHTRISAAEAFREQPHMSLHKVINNVLAQLKNGINVVIGKENSALCVFWCEHKVERIVQGIQ